MVRQSVHCATSESDGGPDARVGALGRLRPRYFFFSISIPPLNVFSLRELPPLFTTPRISFGENLPDIVIGNSELTRPLNVSASSSNAALAGRTTLMLPLSVSRAYFPPAAI